MERVRGCCPGSLAGWKALGRRAIALRAELIAQAVQRYCTGPDEWVVALGVFLIGRLV